MKTVSFLAALFLLAPFNSLQAQDILNAATGSVITVQSGAILFVNGGINLANNSTLANAGTVTINRNGAGTANFTDNTITPYAYGTGKFIFTGTGSQTIRSVIIHDLEINNAAGVTMLSDETVNNNLQLTNGSFSIGANTLNVNGTVTGTGKLKGSPTSILAIGGAAGTLNFDQTDSSARSLKNLTLNSGSATLGNAMQIYGVLDLTASSFQVNNQSLVLKSVGNGSTGTARVGNLTGSTLAGASNVTVERYIASPQRAWHLLSAKAVTGTQTIKQAWQENGGPVVAGQGTLVTSNLYNGSNGFDMASISSSILTHNQGGNAGPSYNFTLSNTNTTVLSSNPGYMLFVRGDRNYTPANIPATSPTVLRTNGVLTQGNQAAFISSTGTGRTLVANPYASPIDMETVFAVTVNLAQDMYVWDPSLTGNYGVGGFRLVERTGANTYQQTPVVIGGGPIPDATARYIHSGQAFFLRTTGILGTTDATVQFTEAVKSSNVSVVNPIINGINDQQLIVNLMIVNPGNIESMADGIRVRFDDSYAAAVADDVEKMGNFAENISSYREGKKLIVEKRPMINQHDTIFLRMTNIGIKDYRFQLATLNFVQPGIIGFLEDAFLATRTPVDLSGAVQHINFNVTGNAASSAPDRFRIVFASGTPLPISFTGIKAYQPNLPNGQPGPNIAVEWKVSAELNTQIYEVEKSTDGINFAKVATQPALGNNGNDIVYNWLDVNSVVGYNFYRIRGIANSGEAKYSGIAKLKIGKTSPPVITVYPNPVTNNILFVNYFGIEVKEIKLIAADGKQMALSFTKQSANQLQVKIPASIAKGMYTLLVKTTEGLLETTKIIIL